VAEDLYSNCHDHKDETSDELDKHSEPQKSPTVHRSMFSGHRGSGKQKDEQRKLSHLNKFAMLACHMVAAFNRARLHCCKEALASG
jgi:hypothetical protein